MNIKRLASMMTACTLILSACSLVTPTRSTPVTSPLETPVTTAQAPGTTDVAPGTTVTDTTTTPEVTATEVITLGVDVSASTEVTPTTEVTATTEETATTAIEAPAENIGIMGTDVTSVMVRVRTLNVRSGPGTGYPVVYRLTLRRTANVVGISTDNQWYLIECKEGVEGECWISAGARYVTARK